MPSSRQLIRGMFTFNLIPKTLPHLFLSKKPIIQVLFLDIEPLPPPPLGGGSKTPLDVFTQEYILLPSQGTIKHFSQYV